MKRKQRGAPVSTPGNPLRSVHESTLAQLELRAARARELETQFADMREKARYIVHCLHPKSGKEGFVSAFTEFGHFALHRELHNAKEMTAEDVRTFISEYVKESSISLSGATRIRILECEQAPKEFK